MKDIFISHRRDEKGNWLARNLYDYLERDGFSVFLDWESLEEGPFPEQLEAAVRAATDVIVVLPPHALDRCKDEGDWVRKEIELSLENKKNIIPVIMEGFEWSSASVPATMSGLSAFVEHQGRTASMEYYDGFINRLLKMLHSKRVRPSGYHGSPIRDIAAPELPVNGYIENRQDYENIAARFERGDNPVFITGMGGLGKSQLARHFARKYHQEHPSELFYWVTFHESLEQTLCEIPMKGMEKDGSAESYEIRYEQLAKLSDNIVLIIDNADLESSEHLFRQINACRLRQLPIRVIITTRLEIQDDGAVAVSLLSEDYLVDFMRRELEKAKRMDIPDDALLDIVKMCERHPLTLEIIAKTLATTIPELSVDAIMNCFATCDDSEADPISIQYGDGREQARIFGHLSGIFELAGFDGAYMRLLNFMSLLPVDGIDIKALLKICADEPDTKTILKDLIARGWIYSNLRSARLHPIVCAVVKHQREISWEDFAPCFFRMKELTENREEYVPSWNAAIAKIIENILVFDESIVAVIPEEMRAPLCCTRGRALLNIGRPIRAEEALRDGIDMAEDSDYATQLDLLSYIGIACGKQERPADAYEWHVRYKELAVSRNDAWNIVIACRNLGISLGKLKTLERNDRHNQALVQIEEGLRAISGFSGKKADLERATLHLCRGVSLRELGRTDEALREHRETERIRRRILGPKGFDTASAIGEQGDDCFAGGKIKEAAERYESALAIKQAIYPNGHISCLKLLKKLVQCYTQLDDSLKMNHCVQLLGEMQRMLEAQSEE